MRKTRDELDAPGGMERGWPRDKGTAVPDEEHDQDAELDGQLLDDDEEAALLSFGDLGEVDGYLCR